MSKRTTDPLSTAGILCANGPECARIPHGLPQGFQSTSRQRALEAPDSAIDSRQFPAFGTELVGHAVDVRIEPRLLADVLPPCRRGAGARGRDDEAPGRASEEEDTEKQGDLGQLIHGPRMPGGAAGSKFCPAGIGWRANKYRELPPIDVDVGVARQQHGLGEGDPAIPAGQAGRSR
jgi:hypothetical protein